MKDLGAIHLTTHPSDHRFVHPYPFFIILPSPKPVGRASILHPLISPLFLLCVCFFSLLESSASSLSPFSRIPQVVSRSVPAPLHASDVPPLVVPPSACRDDFSTLSGPHNSDPPSATADASLRRS